MKRLVASAIVALSFATPALADFETVGSRDAFVGLVAGKSLTRPLVKLEVTSNGKISGMGAVWAVTGEWTWEEGYLCRSLYWGGDDLGYDCQLVEVDGSALRITSQRGAGRSARFTLR